MTGARLIASARFSLHDRERDSDTGSLFFTDATIARSLTDAVASLLKDLIEEYPRRAHVTVGALKKECPTVVSGNPAPVPDDFWTLECGTKNGKYVEAVDTVEAVPEAALHTFAKIYVQAQTFQGDADTAIYLRLPPTIAKTGVALPFWPDAVYRAAKWLAIVNLLVQEERQASHRIQLYMTEYLRARLTIF